jgi:outer membrane protein assembly factor BamE (lipoprotein component of BamABCDE complex)
MPRFQTKKPFNRIGVVALALSIAAACSPVIRNHGYTPAQEELSEIRVGQDTRGSVRRKIGRPGATGIFTDEGWYYVSSKVEHLTYNEPRVIDRSVVAIVFDDQDVVASVNSYGLDEGRIIDLETNVTPTYGKELTIVEQLLGNIGAITGSVFDN